MWVGLGLHPRLVRSCCVSAYSREHLARLSFPAVDRLEAPYKNIWHYSQVFHCSKISCTHRALGAQKTAMLPSSLPALKPAVGYFSAPLFHAAAEGEGSDCEFRWLWEVSFFDCFQSPFQCRAPGASSMPPPPSWASDHLAGVPRSAVSQRGICPRSVSFQTGDKQ